MFTMPTRGCIAVLLSVFVLSSLPLAAQGEKRPITHDDYDKWSRIQNQAISADGQWVLYTVTSQEDGGTLHIKNVDSDKTLTRDGDREQLVFSSSHESLDTEDDANTKLYRQNYSVERGTSARFSHDGTRVIYVQNPDPDEVDQAREADEEPPRAHTKILVLATGNTQTIEGVTSTRSSGNDDEWLAYNPRVEEEPAEAEEEEPAEAEEEEEPAEEEVKEEESEERSKPRGRELVLVNLKSGAEFRVGDVSSYSFGEDGDRLFYLSHNRENGDSDGIYVMALGDGNTTAIMQGAGVYKSLTRDDDHGQLLFFSSHESFGAEDDADVRFKLYRWTTGMASAEVIADDDSPGIPEGWEVRDGSSPSFSTSGQRIFFRTRPAPEPEEEEKAAEDEESEGDDDDSEKTGIQVDIWHWEDETLQSQQVLRTGNQNGDPTYEAMFDVATGKITQLTTPDMPSLTIGSGRDGNLGTFTNNDKYEFVNRTDRLGLNDTWLFNLETGEKEIILEEFRGSARLSPGSKYLTWWNRDELTTYIRSVETGEEIKLSDLIPHPIHNEIHDRPSQPGAYGTVGWTEDDSAVLIYDSYDIWVIDPSGFWPARCLTDGFGRENQIRLRRINIGEPSEGPWLATDRPIMLSGLNLATKQRGFFQESFNGDQAPKEVIMDDYQFSTPTKARAADRYLFTRQTFAEFPNIWVSDTEFGDMKQMSDANPQQEEYVWGDAELYEWTSSEGTPLQGVLIKPEGFDPNKKYPMMVFFYERNSDTLHRYRAPNRGSSVNASLYVSNGYVFFIPDIPYKTGFPGESAFSAIVSGVASLIDEGYVDPKAIAAQGHSWGGYQTAYLITRTNIFAAVESGAPVSNMTSAYGGIRWGSGVVRQFQYETGQSRIGESLWDALPKYLTNSPLFRADKIETPVLILHNDEDGAVPWYQGIEFFVALRRLGKPAWMLNYNGEAHGLRQRDNQQDWTIRMLQFFDHYCKGAPPPVWMADGIPAVDKGRKAGLGLVEDWDGKKIGKKK